MEKKSFWTPVITMTAIYFFVWGFAAMDRLLIAMLFPYILPEFKLSFAQAGMLMACMSVGFLVFEFIGGILSDKYGRRKVILPSVFVFSIVSAITGFATGFAQLIGVRTIVGAGEGAFATPATAHIFDECPPEKRGIYLGFYVSAFALFGSFVAPIYATQIAAHWGWRWAFYLTIIPGIVLALLIWGFVKESVRFRRPEQAAAPKARWRQVMKERNIVVACLLAICWMVWLWSWLSFGTVFFVNVKHLSTGMAGILQSALGAGGFLGMIALPGFSDKVGRRIPLIVGTIIGLVGTAAIVYLPGTSPVLMWIALFVTAFVTWGYSPIILSVIPSESVPPERIAFGVACVTGLAELAGIAVAPPILGAIGDKFGLTTTMLCGGAVLIPVLLLASFALRETAPKFTSAKARAPSAVR
jgi:MFS family permease